MNLRLFALAFVALAIVATLPAQAQTVNTGNLGLLFGTQVNSGQPDFVPVSKKNFNTDNSGCVPALAGCDKDNLPVRVLRNEFGEPNVVTDDILYFDLELVDSAAPFTGTIDFEDIRLTSTQGKIPGQFIADADISEKNAAETVYDFADGDADGTGVNVVFADVNNNGHYDLGDFVYLTTDVTAPITLAPTNAINSWTLRLTPSGGKAAGTFVVAADSDFTSYQASVTTFSVARVMDFEGGRHNLVFSNLGRGALIPQFSLRVKNNDAAGAFGTQLKFGDVDFLPQNTYGRGPATTGIAAAANIAVPASVRVGPTGIYSSAATTLAAADIRLVSYVPGLAPGAIAANDPDVGLVVAAPSAATIPVTAIADVDASAGVTAGDLPLLTGVAGAGLATDVAYRSTNRIVQLDLGITNDINDNCLFLDADASAGVSNFDVRLTPCQGKAVGTLVADTDTVEKTATAVGAATYSLVYADVNNNGRYDVGDSVFLTTAAYAAGADTLAASASNTVHTVRLTASGGKAVGTFVFAADSDFSSYAAATNAVPMAFQFFDADMSTNGRLTGSDPAYLQPAATSNLRNKLFPVATLRLTAGNVAGAVGSQLKLGATDFRPTVQEIADPDAGGAAWVAGSPVFLRASMGDPVQVTDDCLYVSFVNAAAANTLRLDTNDVRLTSCMGKAPGTLVTDSDVAEKNAVGTIADAAVDATAAATPIRFAEAKPDNGYKLDDYLFFTVGAGSTTSIAPSTGTTAYSLRLLNNPGGLAGSYVRASDIDFQSYQAAVLNNQANNFCASFFDADASSGPTPGDLYYLAFGFGNTACGNGFGDSGPELVPRYSVRLSGDFAGVPALPAPSASTSASATPTSTASTSATASATQSATVSASGSSQPVDEDDGDQNATPGLGLVLMLVALGAALVVVRRKL